MQTLLLVALVAGALLFAAGLAFPLLHRPLAHPGAYAKPAPLPPHPSVEVVVPAYLEASEIGAKILDLEAALGSYAGNSLITVMASDDATAEAAEFNPAARVVRCGRRGKPAALNQAVENSRSDVLVFTDANCRVQPENWPDLVVRQLDTFSLVSATKSERGSSDRLYWLYERLAKSKPGVRATLGVVGEFVALRRVDFRPIPEATLLDDLVLAHDLALRGLAACVDPQIETVEDAPSQRDQWNRRTRICEGVLRECSRGLRSMARHPLGRRLLLHKFYRMTIGCLGFWIAVGALALLLPDGAALTLAVLAVASVLIYAGLVRAPAVVVGLVAPVGMQAVPLASMVALSITAGRRRSESGWQKVAR